MLLTLAPAPAGALTLQRSWHASLSSGTYGAVSLKAYTNGVGSLTYNLKRLRANRTYSVQIRKGTCASTRHDRCPAGLGAHVLDR